MSLSAIAYNIINMNEYCNCLRTFIGQPRAYVYPPNLESCFYEFIGDITFTVPDKYCR